LTARKFLGRSLRSVTSASTSLSCVATAAAFGHRWRLWQLSGGGPSTRPAFR